MSARQSLNRNVTIQAVEQCDEPGCEQTQVMAIENPHVEEDKIVYLDVHCAEVSFGIPRDEMCKFLSTLRGLVPTKGYIKIKGIDVIGNPRNYCLVVDTALQWQLILQIGACHGPKAFQTALGAWGK
jgi:hypothetical protein